MPIADLRVCFSCGEWSWNGDGPTALPTGAERELAELCRGLGLDRCPPLNAGAHEEDFDRYRDWQESGAPPRPSETLAIPKERKLAELSESEKRKLCAWRVLETGIDAGVTFELDAGHCLWGRATDRSP